MKDTPSSHCSGRGDIRSEKPTISIHTANLATDMVSLAVAHRIPGALLEAYTDFGQDFGKLLRPIDAPDG
jgi:hypothetical protein